MQPSRSVRTRQAILAAAEAVFAERGFGNARLEDIAERVGITRPSIVYHFADKRDLYEAVLEDTAGELLRRIERGLAGAAPCAQRIENAVRAWVGYVAERPGFARILLREAAKGSEARSPTMAKHVAPILAAMTAVVREGQRRGEFQPIDPIHLIFTIAGATVFVLAAAPTLAPDWPHDPLSSEQVRTHEQELLKTTRRLLGIFGPPRAPASKSGAKRKLP